MQNRFHFFVPKVTEEPKSIRKITSEILEKPIKESDVLTSKSRWRKSKIHKNTKNRVYCIQSANKIHKKQLDFQKMLVYYLLTNSTDISDV